MSAVAVESGKRKHAAFRWACDKRLRDALATLADSSRHHNAWAADMYPAARAPAATTTSAPSAPSNAPGAVSCGASGKTDSPTTPPATAACDDTSPSPSPLHPAPGRT